MSKVRFRISMSLDGFVAGPRQSIENPLGIGGMRLHEWVFPLAVWRATHGLEGGEGNESTAVIEESLANIGATVMGRNMFGGHPGPWDRGNPWNGWWGANPPFHHPVFVLTHHPRAPLECQGGTTFTFVTEGIEAALAQAHRAAGGKDVSLAGGANAARQYLAAGFVDEMEISLVPTLLGSGERLFDGAGDDLHGLELVRTVVAPNVTHLKFAKRRFGARSGATLIRISETLKKEVFVAVNSKVIKKSAAKFAKKAIKSGKDMAEDVMDNARPKLKALKKAAVKKTNELKKAAAPKVKQLKKAAAPRVKAMKKAAGKAAGKIKEQARGITKNALNAGSRQLKKAAKAI